MESVAALPVLLVTLGIGIEPGYAMIRASEASVSASQTIVRKVRGGTDPASHRFVLLYETEVRNGFAFQPIGVELTLAEVCAALIAHGLSETDALALINDAEASFDRP